MTQLHFKREYDAALMDKVRMADARTAGNACMAVMTAVQDFPKEAQVLGIAASFVLLAERLGVTPHTLYEMSERLIGKADAYRPEFKGARAYMENEL